MKADDLIDMIGDVDDSLIAEAKADQGNKRIKKREIPRWLYWTAAACLCIAAVISVMKNYPGDNGPRTGVRLVKAADLMEGIEPGDAGKGKTADAYSKEVSDFAVRLFKACEENRNNKENTLVSPLSVMLLLSMTSNGMDGRTLKEAEKVIGLSVEKLNAFSNAYMQTLSERSDNTGSLDIANAIWFKTDPAFTVYTDFLQKNADNYRADLYAAPFDGSTLNEINSWVDDKTKGMIPEILGALPSEAIMCLVNALAFDAKWRDPYNEEMIKDGTFTTAEGEAKQVSFMHGTEELYLEDKNSTGFIKYYAGGKYAFAAILPKEGMTPDEYLETLTGAHLSKMLSGAKEGMVITSMPKFKTEYAINDMAELLGEMGMTLAFDPEKADFGNLGTYEGQNIYINTVVHKTFMAVDENGTKAGAATAATLTYGTSFSREDVHEVYLTRPFIYMLIDTESNIPLFIGTMRDPEQ